MPRASRIAASAALALALAACGGDSKSTATTASAEGPTMSPGVDCLVCHDGAKATAFTAAGTVFASATAAASEGIAGATVTIAGATRTVSMDTNAAGNFYFTEAFGFPATVKVTRNGTTRTMNTSLTKGGCAAGNLCHPAAGRVHVP
jgi:hypothetical protein